MQDVTRAVRLEPFKPCAVPPARRKFEGRGLGDYRNLAELISALEPVERGAHIGHGELGVDSGLDEPAVEHVEKAAQLANASAGGPVDFELPDEEPLQISRRIRPGRRAAGHEPPSATQRFQRVAPACGGA